MPKKPPYADYGNTLLAAFQSIGWGARQLEQYFRRENVNIDSAQIAKYLSGQALPTLETHGLFIDILSSNHAQGPILNALNQHYAQAAPASVSLLSRVERESPLQERIAQSKNFMELLDILIEEKFPGDTEHSYSKTWRALFDAGYVSGPVGQGHVKLGVKADLNILAGVFNILGVDNTNRSFRYEHDQATVAETTAERLVRFYLDTKTVLGNKEITYSGNAGPKGGRKLVLPEEYIIQAAEHAKAHQNFPLLVECLKQAVKHEEDVFFELTGKSHKDAFLRKMSQVDFVENYNFDYSLYCIFRASPHSWITGNEVKQAALDFIQKVKTGGEHDYAAAYRNAEDRWPEATPQTVQAVAERISGKKPIIEDNPAVKIDAAIPAGRVAEGKVATLIPGMVT